jgi:hypothetical protein
MLRRLELADGLVVDPNFVFASGEGAEGDVEVDGLEVLGAGGLGIDDGVEVDA